MRGMSPRTALFMLGGALLVPLGALFTIVVVATVVPAKHSIAESLSIVWDRIWGKPVAMLAFTFWVLVFASLGALLARVGRRRQRKDRERLGLCPNCGYDLRASKDRCPECGAATCRCFPGRLAS